MRFATRAFLWSFLPFAVLLLGSFWAIQMMVIRTVHGSVHDSLLENQRLMTRLRAKSELQSSRSLRVVAENPALKAGIQLLLQHARNGAARLTVEDQLREICSGLGYDFLVVRGAGEQPLAGVLRRNEMLDALDITQVRPPQRGYFELGGQTYQVASVPIDEGQENLATLSVGERLDFAEFSTPAVLTRNGRVVVSNMATGGEQILSNCGARAECEVRLQGQTYLSLPLNSMYFGDGYVLRSLQSVDAAAGPVQTILRDVFLITGLAASLAALIVGFLSSRSVARPLARVVSQLRAGEATGVLPELPSGVTSIQEIRELCESFNHAASAIRDGRENLDRAYVEFIESMASALDARDQYTAGHSRRVSEFSCLIAQALNVGAEDLEEIRIGSLLHDIGKIGISDSVLQKPGKLTPEEFAIIQQHPSIGRRILEGVQGFHRYLAVVELHHENWDGSGYPHGLHGNAIPLSARIVHVADAFDAMTSDRPYRRGMSHELALRILIENESTQFDAAAVSAFVTIMGGAKRDDDSIARLAEAVAPEVVANRA